MSDEETKVEEPKPEETKEQWDKERQQADQERATVVKKLSQSQATLEAELAATKEGIASLTSKLDSLLNKADVKKSQIDTLDPDIHGADMVAAIQSLKAELDAERSSKAELQTWIQSQKQEQARKKADAEKEALKDEILTDLDDQFGAKYRNEAIELANAEVAETGKAPVTQMQARKLLAKHYKALRDKDSEAEKKKTSRQDTLGGTLGIMSDDLEEGSMDDVMASMKKKGVFTTLDMPG